MEEVRWEWRGWGGSGESEVGVKGVGWRWRR